MSIEKFNPLILGKLQEDPPLIIKIVGIGCAGTNVVSRICNTEIPGVEYVAMSADIQTLEVSACPHKVRLGKTAGFYESRGAEVGRQRAIESEADIYNALHGANLVILVAGLGGSTGTGAAPVVAHIAGELGILTVGMVTTPFPFEGKRRMERAEQGVAALLDAADAVVVFPNKQPVFGSPAQTLETIFKQADDLFCQRIEQMRSFINHNDYIKLTLRDLHEVIKHAGFAHFAFVTAAGDGDERRAAEELARDTQLLDSVRGARYVLVRFEHPPPDGSIKSFEMVIRSLSDAALPDAVIIFAASISANLSAGMRVTTFATGFDIQDYPWTPPLDKLWKPN